MPILIFHMERFWVEMLMPGEDLNLLLHLSWSIWVAPIYVGFYFTKHNWIFGGQREGIYKVHRQNGWDKTIQFSFEAKTDQIKCSLKVLENSNYEISLKTHCPVWWLWQQLLLTIWTDTCCDKSCSLKSQVRVRTWESAFCVCQFCHQIRCFEPANGIKGYSLSFIKSHSYRETPYVL